MLVDDVHITIAAGKGGNGSVSFRRNAQTAKGGPDGGNGGNGGSVYIQGIDDILGLAQFRFKKQILAEDGIKGAKQNLFGRNGKDALIQVPLGTVITDTTSLEVWEITDTTAKLLLAQGGKGGRGNNEFKSATNQTPRFAEKGTIGQERSLHLKLLLIADIGLIGLPNAGKSSLLASLTHATPKIANYPFTTLEPNLGMMGAVTLADIPGLIEGAHTGKGLGIQFLRHIEKTKLLLHCIDITSENIAKTYTTVRTELGEYNKEILTKPEILLLTKSDIISEKDAQKVVKKAQKLNPNVQVVSVLDDNQLRILKETLIHFVHNS